MKLFADVNIDDDIRVVVHSRTPEGNDRVFVFEKLDKVSHKTYNDIAYGRGGRRKGNPERAVYFLFEKKCKAVEGLTREEEQMLADNTLTAKQVMLSDTNEYGVLIDMIVGRYLNISLPDTEELGN
jgi:hypothetical protein